MKRKIPEWVRIRDPQKRREAKELDTAQALGVKQDGNAYVSKNGVRHPFNDEASRQLAFLLSKNPKLPPISKRLKAFLTPDGKLGIRGTRDWHWHMVADAPLRVLIEKMEDCERQLASAKRGPDAEQETTTTNNENPNESN